MKMINLSPLGPVTRGLRMKIADNENDLHNKFAKICFFGGIIIFLRVCCAFSLGYRAAGRGGWNSFPPLRQHLFFMPLHVGTPLWYVRGLLLCCSWSFLSFFGCRGCETFSGFVYISRKKGQKVTRVGNLFLPL